MNKVNPLYLIMLLITILILTIYYYTNTKQAFQSNQTYFHQAKKIGLKTHALWHIYGDKKFIQSQIENILSQSSLHVKTQKTENFIKISGNRLPYKQLNNFLSQILNYPFAVQKLKIIKNDNTHASISLEILW